MKTIQLLVSALLAATLTLTNLTLEAALEFAEREHPRLAEARALAEAAGARLQVAGRPANPEAILRAEQLPFKDTPARDRQFVVGVAQTVSTGARLSKAREAGRLEQEALAVRWETVRREVRRRVHAAFATALYQAEARREQAGVAEDYSRLTTVIQARLAAGDAVPEELARAEMELARARTELRRSELLHQQAKEALTAALGVPDTRVVSLEGRLEATLAVPTLEALAASFTEHPEMREARAALRAGEARVELAEAERIPDVTAELLYRRLEATRQDTVDVGLRIPLPLFNSGQARVREARAEAAVAEARVRQTEVELRARIIAAHTELRAALAQSRALKEEILPRAEMVLKAAETRHAAGDLALGELLVVRRDAAAVRLSHLESLRDVMRAGAELLIYFKSP